MNESESRIFLLFDCFNKVNKLNFKNYYDINSKISVNKLKDSNEWDSNIISLSSNTIEKNYFHEFFKINFINDKIQKFYSHFTIYFLKYLVDYLQLNVNFTTYTYESMYKGLIEIVDDNQLKFSEKEDEVNNEVNNEVLEDLKKNCCCDNKNSIFLSFSKKELIKSKFLDTKIIEEVEIKTTEEKVEKKINIRSKALAYKNVELERKIKILQNRNDNLVKQIKILKKYENRFLKFNF